MAQVITDGLRVEVGYGSTPLTPLASITWTDVTSSVMLARGVNFSRGKTATDTTARPGTCSFTLDNSAQAGGAGRFTTKTAAWESTALWGDSATAWAGQALNTSGFAAETAAIGGVTPMSLRLPVRIRARYPFSTVNLVSNPSFETDTTGWAALASSAIARSTSYSFIGAASGQVTWAAGASSSQAVIINCTTVTGQTYTVSFWVYVPGGAPDVAATCNLVSTGTATTVKDRWVRISHTFVAGGTTSSVGVRNMTTATAGQTCYIDGVQCEAGSTVSPYSSGAATTTTLWVGYVESLQPGWEDGVRPVVRVDCADRLARLQRKKLPSLILGEQLYDVAYAAFPLNESTSSAYGNRSIQPGVESLAITQTGTGGTIASGVADSAPGPDGLTGATFTRASASNGKYLRSSSLGTNWASDLAVFTNVTMECYFKIPATGFQAGLMSLVGGISPLNLYVDSTGKLCATYGSWTITGTTTLATDVWYHAVFESDWYLLQSSALYLNGSLEGISANYAQGGMTSLWVGAYADTSNAPTNLLTGTVANVAVYMTQLSTTRIGQHNTAKDTLTNFTGESSENRFKRICRIAGINDADRAIVYGTSGATSATMSPFAVTGTSPYDCISNVADTEASGAWLSRSGIITLESRDYRDETTVSFTIPAQAVDPGTAFTTTTAFLINDVTVNRPGGASVRWVDSTSVAAYDTHDASKTIYASTDAAVTELAAWTASENSSPSTRVDDISVDLVTGAQLLDTSALLSAEVGQWFAVNGLPTLTGPAERVDLFVEGISDRVTPTSWERTIVGSPASSSAVWILDDDSYSILDDTTVLGF